jgi:pantoate kinase
MKFSREFAEHVGLISGRMREVLKDTDKIGLTCSMMMLGESIFSIVKRSRINELREIFNKYAPSKESIIVSDIDYEGARLL